jgi:hypothetical protein
MNTRAFAIALMAIGFAMMLVGLTLLTMIEHASLPRDVGGRP